MVNDDNPDYGTEGGNDTTDKVYLLSINEVTNTAYGFSDSFENSEMRESVNTAYVADGGEIDSLYMSGAGISDEWWLRSPGLYSFFASDVNNNGFVYRYGYDVYYNANAVRPALHLNLSSSSWSYASTVTSDGVVSEEATPVPTIEPTATPSAMPGLSATPAPSMSPTASPESSERPITSARPATSPNSDQSDTVVAPESSTTVKAPAKVTKVTIKSKKGKLQAKWKKVTGANAYEICYSTSKKFTKEKKLTKNKSTKKTEITIKKLKRGKRYFVKVRAYTLQDGKKVYGKWSKVRKAKIE